MKREPRSITINEIDQEFPLDRASFWFGDRWSPAVHRRTEGGYAIRVVKSLTVYGSGETYNYDYFYLDDDGVITTAPRGHARDYKPGRVIDIEAAVERFAIPSPNAVRIGLDALRIGL
jgi:hypothetical protein